MAKNDNTKNGLPGDGAPVAPPTPKTVPNPKALPVRKKKPTTEAGSPNKVTPPPDDTLGIALGVEQNLPFSTPYNPVRKGTAKTDNEQLMEVMRADGYFDDAPTIRQLVLMRRQDGQARALYRLLTLPIRSALSTATWVPAEGGENEAAFIEQVFNTPPAAGGMTVTFHRFMSQLLQGLFDGFAAFEKVFWIPESGPLQGKITLKKMAVRPPDTIHFITGPHGGFEGFRQRASVNGKTVDVYIPKEQSFYYAAQEEERKFYGVSFFESAFYHYDAKVKMYFTAHLAAQRAAVGTRIGTVPANASRAAKQEFATQLANLAFAQFMMIPDDYKVELLKDTSNFDFLAQINHHNSQMSKSVLASFFDKEQGAGQSEGTMVNFAQPGDEMFILMLRAVMDDIANQINHYIVPQLIDYNFPGGLYPKFSWGTLTDEQRSAIADIFSKLAVTAATSQGVTPEFMRALEENMAEQMGLDIDYAEVEAREQEEQAAQQAQMGVGPDGQPLPPQTDAAGNPLPGAPAPVGGAQPPTDGSTPPADGSTPPAGPSASTDGSVATEVSPDGSTKPFDFAGFEKQVSTAGQPDSTGSSSSDAPSDAPTDPATPKPKKKVALSAVDENLIALAAGLLDAAREEVENA